jgi:hypothetical protein
MIPFSLGLRLLLIKSNYDKVITPFELNDYIMASSLQNPGIGTILHHLVTMKSKIIPERVMDLIRDDPFQMSYV